MDEFQQLISIDFSKAQEQGKLIYQQLPEQLKNGSLYKNDGDFWKYLAVYLSSTLFFFFVYFFLKSAFNYFSVSAYINRDKPSKIRYLYLWVNNVHHFIIIIFSLYAIGNACSENSNWPIKGVTQYFSWFSNDQCFLQFDQNFAFAVMITDGFLTMDYVVLKFWLLDRNKLTKQTEIHHFMASSGFTIALFSGYALAGISTCSLICEISSLFLNYKDMFSKENKNSPLSQFNQLCFFITFTAFRIILFPYLSYCIFIQTQTMWQYSTTIEKSGQIFCLIQSILVTLLNFYWYILIWKGLIRLMQEVGIVRKNQNQAFDDLNDYEALGNEQKLIEQDFGDVKLQNQ